MNEQLKELIDDAILVEMMRNPPWPNALDLFDALWDISEHIREPQGASIWIDSSCCVIRRKDAATALAKLKAQATVTP